MANFVDVPVLSKLKIGAKTYYLKDAEVRALIPGLEAGIAANAADIDLLEANKQDNVAFADGYDAVSNKAATVKTVTDAVKDITSFEFEIVTELPETGKKGTIYLKKHTESGVDMYEEFIWVNNRFEKIGDTRIDLSNYYTKAQVDAAIKVESDRAKDAEDDLTDDIAKVAGDLADEVARAEAAEQANTAAISAEASTARAAEQANAAAISAEETRAKAAEEANAAAITAEAERADAAEKVNAAAIAAEKTRAEGAESDLAADIAAEETRAKAAEAELATDIENLGKEMLKDASFVNGKLTITDGTDAKKVDHQFGALADKSSASGTVAGQTISNVKASGTSTGDITGALDYASTTMESSGIYKPEGSVSVTGSAIASASLTNNTPVTVQSMATAGSVASFSEGAFTPASLGDGFYTAGSAASYSHSGFSGGALATPTKAGFAKAGVVAHVGVASESEDTECLYFEDAQVENAVIEQGAFTAAEYGTDSFVANVPAVLDLSKFNGGSKAADSFTANVLPTFEEKSVMPSDASISTSAASLGAEFTGTSKSVSVSGNYDKANLGTVAFAGKAIELNVGDIVVESKDVTVS